MTTPRVRSLLDIMNNFKVEALATLCLQAQIILQQAEVAITIMGFGADHPSPTTLMMIPRWVATAKQVFADVELTESLKQVQLAEHHLASQQLTNLALRTHMNCITETLVVELRSRKFLFVAEDRSEFLEADKLFGDALSRFDDARKDVIAAGNCLAAECHTAAVFHLMVAFEWVLRTYAASLGLKRLKDWDKQRQRFKYTPVNYSQWEKILNQLPKRAEKRLGRLRPGPKKQRLQEYYSSCYEDIKCVKDAWRNHVVHSRQRYDRGAAHDVFGHVKDIIIRMASGKGGWPR